jgi:hypothetical protein
MGPGDELTIEFDAPQEEPSPGWARDYILYNVGWDKDADLNTVLGQSSEPYPFRAMKRYPPGPEESTPSSIEYQEYLRSYQTREYPKNQMRNAIRHPQQ